MAYLEELLKEFRKGAKIRCKGWSKEKYIHIPEPESGEVLNEKEKIVTIPFFYTIENIWELYKEPEPDWGYIKNKCLCWFWNGDDRNNGVIDYLVTVSNESYEFYEDTSGCRWSHCRPVRRDEVTFYEDKKDD